MNALEQPDVLRDLPLLSDFSDLELEKTGRLTFIKTYPQGQMLFAEGMPGEIMYVVISGAVEIYKHGGNGDISIARLGKGEFVGEGSLILDGQRSTNCRVVEDAKLLLMTKKALQDLVQSCPSASSKLLSQFLKTNIMRLRSGNRKLGWE